jgi:hypothetical protein
MNAIKSEILLVRQEEEIQPQINTALHGFFKPARVPAQSVTALAASASMSLMVSPVSTSSQNDFTKVSEKSVQICVICGWFVFE